MLNSPTSYAHPHAPINIHPLELVAPALIAVAHGPKLLLPVKYASSDLFPPLPCNNPIMNTPPKYNMSTVTAPVFMKHHPPLVSE